MTAFKGANDPRTDPLAQAAEIESNINDRAGIRAYAEEIYKGKRKQRSINMKASAPLTTEMPQRNPELENECGRWGVGDSTHLLAPLGLLAPDGFDDADDVFDDVENILDESQELQDVLENGDGVIDDAGHGRSDGFDDGEYGGHTGGDDDSGGGGRWWGGGRSSSGSSGGSR
ncbi:hypothetical protein TMatcc_007274 [Talaromyces marneffei ATCC 18224]|uniref:uncharacterized protein n=1 Tax=Talaromyces marneffei TaxID=37727 RepID=UPI0012A810F7|nr:uncharacterized protein EYB26_004254 [Talaromyces marneffei]QGA16587.1 hypothetical protein EYB26_004254 [Talaromyces marneffei]